MRHHIILFILTLLAANVYAQSPKWAKKAKAAQVSIVAYTENGQMKEAQGAFIDKEGTIITEYDFLKGACKASVIDSKGNELSVKEIAGANAMYNVARLKTDIGKNKITPLEIANNSMTEQTILYILPNVKADKNAICTVDTIMKAEGFKDTFTYYTLSKSLIDRQSNSPAMNENGEMVGLVQLAAKEGGASYVIDARYAASLRIAALDAGNADLKAINIKKSLPDTEKDATTYIYLVGQKDTMMYRSYIDDFILMFPQSTTGYVMKAEARAEAGDYASAKATYEQALGVAGIKKDEVLYSMSQTIYKANMSASYNQFEDWNLERARQEAVNAYAENPLPLYIHQEANCLYAMKQYDDAAEKFIALTKTNLRSPDMFMYAVQCKQSSGAGNDEILALLDSALNCYPKPYPVAAANTIIMRAKTLAEAGKTRDAVMGYNDFEHLSGSNLSANFYYEREQLEVKCRMYPAALNDIEKAIKLSPKEAILYAEAAALNYRVGEVDDAIRHAEKAIEVDDKFTDAYRILGVCQIQKGNSNEARKNLQKAIELGDTMAQGVLDKMK